MKKSLTILLFALFFLVLVSSSVQAVSSYVFWADNSTSFRTFTQGTDVNFNYTGIGPSSNQIKTMVYFTDLSNTNNPVLLVNNTTLGGIYGVNSVLTSNLTPGNYSIFSIAYDLTTGFDDTDYLFFDVVPTNNTAPYFNSSLNLSYTYNINLVQQANVVDLSQFGLDDENDPLTYSINTSNTNPAITTCSLVSGSVIDCSFHSVGTTTLDAIVSDGQLSTAVAITINVINSSTGNLASYFVNLPANISLPGVCNNQVIINLSQYSFDPDSDPMFYSFNSNVINSNILDNCSLSGSVLTCDAVGSGNTYVAFSVSDNFHAPTWAGLQVFVGNVSCNTAPYFSNNMGLFYSYNINLNAVDVVDLSQFAYDAEFDTVSFSLDTTNTNSNIVSCSLTPSTVIGVPPTPFTGNSNLHCDLNGLGLTSVDVIVSDGQLSTTVTVQLQVYNTTGNLAPYFDNMSLYYSYNLNLVNVNVVDLDNFGVDPNNDPLTYLIDTTNTDPNVINCQLIPGSSTISNSLLNCNLIGVGTTTLKVGVTDGFYTTWATATINVYSLGTNNTAPYFLNNFQTYYSENIANSPLDIVELSHFVNDAQHDTVSFSLDQSSTDLSVVSCSLTSTIPQSVPLTPFLGNNTLHCDLNSVGTTTLDVIVSDGQLSSTVTVTINVYQTSNTAPYFGSNMNLYYTYNKDLVPQTDVVNVAHYANDAEFDAVSFSLDQSSTDANIAVCTLDNAPIVPSPTPYFNPSMLNCVFNGVGITTVGVIISDGNLNSQVTVTLDIFDTQSTLPIAIISSPGTSDYVGQQKIVDGSKSYSPSGLAIVNYDWNIVDAYGNSVYTTSGVSKFPFNFTAGTYTIRLIVTDSAGNSGHTTKTYKVYEDSSANGRAEKGLKIADYKVYGYDFEKATVGGDLTISSWVENKAGEDLNNVHMTYTLPEFGIRFSSSEVSIKNGERKHLIIHANVPYDVSPGVYYPYISFSNGDIRRVKAGYLEVY